MPTGRSPAGMVKLADPKFESETAVELYEPPDKVTVPVGEVLPGPVTPTLTLTLLATFPFGGADTFTVATAAEASTVNVWLVVA